MNKMKTPEMEVIRFKEADVIVASGDVHTMTLAGFQNDGVKRNGILTYNGIEYHINNGGDSINPAINAMRSIGVTENTLVYANDTSSYGLWGLLRIEDGAHVSSIEAVNWDGTYSYVNGVFRKQ